MNSKDFQSLQTETSLKPSFEREEFLSTILDKAEPRMVAWSGISDQKALSYKCVGKFEELDVKGQGTVKIKSISSSLVLELLTADLEEGFKVQINENEVKLYLRTASEDSLPLTLVKSEYAKKTSQIETETKYTDDEETWVSLETHTEEPSYLRIGKGEARLETTLLSYEVTRELQSLAKEIKHWRVLGDTSSKSADKFPVRNWPLLIGEAANSEAITKKELNSRFDNQILEDLNNKVLEANARLQRISFPGFLEAIERSCKDEKGWCFNKLIEKGRNRSKNATYLRITLGGESLESPYVMEVWPPGHFSTLHQHSKAYCVVRNVSGEIAVQQYRSLSLTQDSSPFIETTLKEGDVTWMNREYNQTHKLINNSDKICITIQCYHFDRDNKMSFEFIDHNEKEKKSIRPKSDCDYLEFKEIIQKEWEALSRQ